MKRGKNTGVCKFCNLEAALCKSHAIPDAIFRRLFRRFSGKAIEISGRKFVGYSSDSWWDYQLCSGCEEKFNLAYDKKAIKYLIERKYREPYGSGVLLKDISADI